MIDAGTDTLILAFGCLFSRSMELYFLLEISSQKLPLKNSKYQAVECWKSCSMLTS